MVLNASSDWLRLVCLRGFSIPQPPPNHVPTNLLWPLFGYVAEYTQRHSNTVLLNHPVAVFKKASSSFSSVSSCPRVNPFSALQISLDVGDALDSSDFLQPKVSENLILSKEDQSFGTSDSAKAMEEHKEWERRRKIGLANKGRVPWNKGKKHTAETRKRIRQRTIEALRDPKVKKKMSEHTRPHSDHAKAKISFSLRHLWQERRKLKSLRERFVWSWAESIAKAAKKGGTDQQELEWDSYDKVKQEIALQQQNWVAEKAKAKQMAKARAEKLILLWAASIAKAAKRGGSGQQELEWDSFNKMKQEMVLQRQLQLTAEKAKAKEMAKLRVRIAQTRKEMQKKSSVRRVVQRKTNGKSKEDKDVLAVAQEPKHKRKLAKIQKKKSVTCQVAGRGDTSVSHFGGLGTLDLEHIKREKQRREISLAEQIQAIRKKKAESTSKEVLSSSSSEV